MSYQPYTESSWGAVHLLRKDRRVFFTSFRKKILLGWQVFSVGEDCCCSFLICFFLFLCFHHIALPQFCVGHRERVNHDDPGLGSFLTSGIIFFNTVVGKSAVTCQKIKQPIFHHKLNKHWKISILQGPLAYASL